MSEPAKLIDPTANVIALNAAEAQRQDDLRLAAEKLFDAKIDAVNKRIDDAVKQVETTATTLRAQVETTAKAKDEQFAAFQSETYKRLSQVEISASATGAGTSGEKAGRVSQQQLLMMGVSLIVAVILIVGTIVGVAYFVRPR